ncbi:hypothetical protein VSH64_08145 [Amycolatopsis rhabdoformis]|uniref:Nuclear transport factor 2 family protein n=1 Tax=Amycolatopsis rhabdoformis TaxID=1448059 RepID=A0ABZ1ICV1_9PSEU|nr:hypothetical protein [Amycolatopsis rhabdoformis]WSE32077.1 hypothetical protein VSH64_08145 [Amycolatopsis rhabdoformis]
MKVKWVVAGVVVLVLAAGAGYVFLSRGTGAPAQGSVAQQQTSPAPKSEAPKSEAHEVAVALGALVHDPASLVATSSRELVGGRAAEGVPPGSSVVADEATWSPDGVGGGVIDVTLRSPGYPPTDFAAVMVREGRAWKVAATVPIPGPTR